MAEGQTALALLSETLKALAEQPWFPVLMRELGYEKVLRCKDCKWANSRGECAYDGEEAEDIKMCYCNYGDRKGEVES